MRKRNRCRVRVFRSSLYLVSPSSSASLGFFPAWPALWEPRRRNFADVISPTQRRRRGRHHRDVRDSHAEFRIGDQFARPQLAHRKSIVALRPPTLPILILPLLLIPSTVFRPPCTIVTAVVRLIIVSKLFAGFETVQKRPIYLFLNFGVSARLVDFGPPPTPPDFLILVLVPPTSDRPAPHISVIAIAGRRAFELGSADFGPQLEQYQFFY